ncbi:MAG: baseplate J/gp47 family protein [Firmicutes bacterium]|nr:baseplate J/gp47 family protein [Bacillota bacterium]
MGTEYVAPDFLQNQDVETIHNNMKANVPLDLDTSEAQFFHDATMPVAIEKAEMVEFKLNETIKVCFPQWAYGIYLDMHAEMAGLSRKAAVSATGTQRFYGLEGVFIPEGFIIATPAVGDQPSTEFKTLSSANINVSGYVDIPIEAVLAGTSGNVASNTITLMQQPQAGITSTINLGPTSGGTEEEDDESLRSRILEAKRNIPMSGSISDYKLWAKEVDGVGEIYVVPEWNGAGTVKIIVIDSNGQPANQALIDAVQEHIAPGGKNVGGLAPIGALVTVVAPVQYVLNIEFTWTIEEGADPVTTLDAVKQAFDEYYIRVGVGGLVRISEIGACIINTQGVVDYTGLTVNGAGTNLQLAGDEFPVTGTVTANE